MPYKLPPSYTERVLAQVALATPPFHENYKIDELITRNIVQYHILNPNYMSMPITMPQDNCRTVDNFEHNNIVLTWE